MNKMSILLGLSGSQQSKYAAELAWKLATKFDATVTAQHVIDTDTIWNVLRNEKPGFIGASPYIAAYEATIESLKELSVKLGNAYEAQAAGAGVSTEFVVDFGNPVLEISKRALSHDLVIVGHEPYRDTSNNHHLRFVRYAIAEGLAHDCRRPLIIVQTENTFWNRMHILMSTEHVNQSFIHSAVHYAEMMEIPSKIVCLGSGVHEEAPASFVADFRKSNPDLGTIPIEYRAIPGMAVENRSNMFAMVQQDIELDGNANTLIVMPTREVSGRAVTFLGTAAEAYVRRMSLPSIMFCPEEYVAQSKTEAATQLVTR